MHLPTTNRRLRTYLAGATISRTGDEMSGPALLLLAMATSDAVSTGPALVAALTAATAVGGPVLGVLVDRARRPGRLLALALMGFAAVIACVALLIGHVGVPALVAVALVGGLFRPALSGGWSSRLPDVVPARELPRASALDGLTFDVAALAAPVLVGGLALVLSPAYAVALAVLAILLAAPAAHATGGTPRRTGRRPRLRQQVLTGFLVIARNRRLRRATVTSVIGYAGVGLILTAAPLLAAHVLGEAGYGPWLVALTALAALVGNAVYAARPDRIAPDRVLAATFCLLAAAAGLAALALVVSAPPVGVCCLLAAAVLTGAADGPQLSALLRIRHRDTPDEVRGQVFTTAASLKLGGAALGAALCGVLASALPLAMVTAMAVELFALLCFAALSRPTSAPQDGARERLRPGARS
ncbi:MFS transporter [Promicromonospora sp. NPDC060271]|uniref:MFS transporter n=1 Tax=Promicromonospora sp. NPDC060271 TaxID=3347089 RepID=UPI003649E40B